MQREGFLPLLCESAWKSRLTTKKPLNPSGLNEENGAGDEIRTHDIHLGKVALYH